MKRRTQRTRSRAEWKARLAGMSEAQKREFNEHRRRTAKSGYAKRQRERDNGSPMASRTHEGIRQRFVTPRAMPHPDFGGWLKGFHRLTALALLLMLVGVAAHAGGKWGTPCVDPPAPKGHSLRCPRGEHPTWSCYVAAEHPGTGAHEPGEWQWVETCEADPKAGH